MSDVVFDFWHLTPVHCSQSHRWPTCCAWCFVPLHLLLPAAGSDRVFFCGALSAQARQKTDLSEEGQTCLRRDERRRQKAFALQKKTKTNCRHSKVQGSIHHSFQNLEIILADIISKLCISKRWNHTCGDYFPMFCYLMCECWMLFPWSNIHTYSEYYA